MGVKISADSMTSYVGIVSRSHNLDGEDFRILSRFSLDTGVKENRVFLVGVGLFYGFCHRRTESVRKVGFISVVW